MLTPTPVRAASRVTICAILAIHNEAAYLPFLLPALAAQEIDVAIVDNGSTDSSPAIYRQFTGRPVISVTHLPYHGMSSLTERLEAKRQLYARCSHDWLVHHDADEVLEHAEPGRSLREAIEEADAASYTALNFEEFTFLPEPDRDYEGRDYYRLMTRYYFFEPSRHRLNRAWRNVPGVSNVAGAGHRLDGPDLRFAPRDHVLRHYIVLSQAYAWRKYLPRRYDPREVQRGWHANRLDFTRENLTLPEEHPCLFALPDPPPGPFTRARPTRRHFWEWEAP
jgi:glycosyltransferase involved in cell wall biosynthesis